VPAVAARQERLVLFIFNRFKGYLDSITSLPKKEYEFTRVLCRGINLVLLGVEMKFFDTLRTDKGENNPLCIN